MTAQLQRAAGVVPFPPIARRRQSTLLAYLRAVLKDLDHEVANGYPDKDFAWHLIERASATVGVLANTLGIGDEELHRLIRAKAWRT